MIQIPELLDKLEIPYRPFGKNVSKGWYEINCPFPYCSDPSFHMGINLDKANYNCWVCGQKGSIYKLLMQIFSISYYNAKKIVSEFDDGKITVLPIEKKEPIIGGEILPKEATWELPQLHRDYLIGRRFDPDTIQEKYQIRSCYTTGRYSYRIIIPVIMNDIIVNFLGRDVTGEQKKYDNCRNESSKLPMKSCIYNLDTIHNKIIIVEGTLDVWRIGDGAIATLGTEYTSDQLSLLATRDIKEYYIMYDSDATRKAEKLAREISTFAKKVEIIELDNGDPCDMEDEEVLKLRKEIGL